MGWLYTEQVNVRPELVVNARSIFDGVVGRGRLLGEGSEQGYLSV